jgi:adenylate cyclase
MLGQVYHALGDKEGLLANARRSLARCERLLAAEPDHSGALGFMTSALADLGEADRAREWTRRAVLFDPDNARMLYNIACSMSELGDAETACDLLEGIIDKISTGWLLWMGADNSLDPIREHPRFKALVARGAARVANHGVEQGEPA